MKRCCDIRLPFKRKRQQSFATSSSQEEKVAPVLLRNRSFSQRLKVLAFLDHSLDQACDSEGGMFWSAFSVAVL
jgi:hypothetical protein